MSSHSTASEALPRMTPAVELEAAVWHVTLALSERESCCKLAEAAIGGHDARRMSVLAAAELAARSLSCRGCYRDL
eukprot:3324385-Prymnesium_polylepis.1